LQLKVETVPPPCYNSLIISVFERWLIILREQLLEARREAKALVEAAADVKALEDVRVMFLGKKGRLTAILKGMGALSPDERPVFGQLANEARELLEKLIGEKRARLQRAELGKRLEEEWLDVTQPGKRPPIGHKHPMTSVIESVTALFIGMGYSVAEGPEIETYYHNFDALNISENHPARDEQDTFYVDGGYVLRTATSPVQVRVMRSVTEAGGKPPIRVIAPGKIFRADEVDATHSPVFHQLEGLVVDKGVTFGDLKGALSAFAKELLGGETQVRFRPHYFPFTEPSAEMDVSCFACLGAGCRVCKNEGWIELLGCGMVHPNVLEHGGIDPAVYSGFAFGMGLERLAMQKYGITDMRLLFENDMRFLTQFNG
jgi:phenylalanyl-tRNA synthetase alpha chain